MSDVVIIELASCNRTWCAGNAGVLVNQRQGIVLSIDGGKIGLYSIPMTHLVNFGIVNVAA